MAPIVKYVFDATSVVCQAVTHVILRDLTYYYWHQEQANLERQNQLSEAKQENRDDKIGTTLLTEKSDDITIFEDSVSGSYTNKEFGVNIKENCDEKENVVKNLEGEEEESGSNDICVALTCDPLAEERQDECGIHHVEKITSEQILDAMRELITPGDGEDVTGRHPSEMILGDCIQNTQKHAQETHYELSETKYHDAPEMPDHYPSLFQRLDEVGIPEEHPEENSELIEIHTETLGNKECSELDLDVNPTFLDNRSLTKEDISDNGSNCSESWVHRFLSLLTSDLATQKRDAAACDCAQTHTCLQVVPWDDLDEMDDPQVDETLTAEQLRSVETGSVSDWLYRSDPTKHLVTLNNLAKDTKEQHQGPPHFQKPKPDCIKHSKISDEQDEIIFKHLYVKHWLDYTEEFCLQTPLK